MAGYQQSSSYYPAVQRFSVVDDDDEYAGKPLAASARSQIPSGARLSIEGG